MGRKIFLGRAGRRGSDQWTLDALVELGQVLVAAPADAALINGHGTVHQDFDREFRPRRPTRL